MRQRVSVFSHDQTYIFARVAVLAESHPGAYPGIGKRAGGNGNILHFNVL